MNLADMTFDDKDHVTAPCAHFGTCGGCQFQDIETSVYQTAKTKAVLDVMAAHNIAPKTLHDTIFIPEGGRRRVTFVARRTGNDVTIGFNQRKSHEIVPIGQCLLITTLVQNVFDKLKTNIVPILKDNAETDISLQEIEGDVEMVLTGQINRDRSESDLLKHMAQIVEQCGLARIGVRKTEFDDIETMISIKVPVKHFTGLNVPIPMGTFLQPSAMGEATLSNIVTAHMPNKKKFNALDLFAGCGTFTGALINHGATVLAYELDQNAVDALAKSLGATKGKSQSLQRHLFNEPVVAREMRDIDLVVLDPPRAGAKEQCAMIAKSNVPHVTYVSCNPQSFARDTQTLLKGGYVLNDLYIVDQFKWSQHTEVVGVFTKSK